MSLTQTPEVIEREPVTPAVPPTQHRTTEPEPAGGSGMMRMLVVLVLVGGAIGFTWWKIHQNGVDQAASAKKEPKGAASIPVTTANVQQKTMPIYLTALGTVTPYYAVTIKSRVDGQLLSVNVREGQAVRKGQVLAQIDPAPYQASVAQAEGQLAKDLASADYAKAEASRYNDLYKAGVVSQDSAQTQASTAGQTAGAIQADKAAIQAAKVNLNYTRIISPIDGVVGLRQVDPGNIVHASDAGGLLLVTQLHPISVIFTLPEDQLPQVQQTMLKGTKLAVEAYDRSEVTHLADGQLVTLDNQIDTTTGTDKVKAVFDNTDNTLFPNQFVNVRLILQQRPNAIVIPSAAVQTGTSGNFVFVVKEGTPPAKKKVADAGDDAAAPAAAAPAAPAPVAAAPATGGEADAAPKGPSYYVEIRPIVVDLTEGTQVIVKSGLKAGEQIVIDGQEKLKANSKVSPKAAGGAGAKGGKKSKAADAGDAPVMAPAGAGAPAGATDKPKQKKGQPS